MCKACCVVFFSYTQIDARGKLTEYAIDVQAIPQLKRGGARIGSFLNSYQLLNCNK